MRQGVPDLVAAHARVCIAAQAMRGPRVLTPRSSTHSSDRTVCRAAPPVSGSFPARTDQCGRARLLPAPPPQGCGPVLVMR